MVWNAELDKEKNADRAKMLDGLKKVTSYTKPSESTAKGGPDGKKAAEGDKSKGLTGGSKGEAPKEKEVKTTALKESEGQKENKGESTKTEKSEAQKGEKDEHKKTEDPKTTKLKESEGQKEKKGESTKTEKSDAEKGEKDEHKKTEDPKTTKLKESEGQKENKGKSTKTEKSDAEKGEKDEHKDSEQQEPTKASEGEDSGGEEGEKPESETSEGETTPGGEAEAGDSETGSSTPGTTGTLDGQSKVWDGAFNFKLEIDGITCGSFQKVAGLQVTTKVDTFPEGGRNTHLVKILGQTSYPELQLTKGYMSSNAELLEYHRVMRDESQEFTRGTVSVIVCNDAGEEVGRYNFFNTWMTEWKGPTFDGKASALSTESVKFSYDYFEYELGGA